MTVRVVVLLSGEGTLLQSLLDAIEAGVCPVDIAAVGSDRPDAPGLVRAQQAGISTFVHPLNPAAALGSAERNSWDAKLADIVAGFTPDLVLLAGFMKILGPDFLNHFPGQVINNHPSLLPRFPGAHAVRDALEAGVSYTGATMFWVDESVDGGQIITQREVEIEPEDTEETLHERIKVVERQMLVETITAFAREHERERDDEAYSATIRQMLDQNQQILLDNSTPTMPGEPSSAPTDPR